MAAWTVGFVPARVLGIMVAGLLLLTNARELATFADLGVGRWAVYGAIVASVGWAATWPRFHGADATSAGSVTLVDTR